MHGAPVTTIDLDFLIRRTPANRKKLIAIAADLRAILCSPIYPASKDVRMMNDDEIWQVDFMDEASGLRSFEDIRKKAEQVSIGSATVRLAALADIITTNKGGKRPRPSRKQRLEQLRTR
jgi:hypothetical protein